MKHSLESTSGCGNWSLRQQDYLDVHALMTWNRLWEELGRSSLRTLIANQSLATVQAYQA